MEFDKSSFEKMKKEIMLIAGQKDAFTLICQYLYDHVPYYNWVGFYLAEGTTLKLGPYVGEPTVHTTISFGQGICGQAARLKHNFVVQDVAKEANYLSCSPEVKSEIVVPMIKKGKVLGELDIDSHYISPFDKADEEFLEWIVELTTTDSELANSLAVSD